MEGLFIFAFLAINPQRDEHPLPRSIKEGSGSSISAVQNSLLS